MRCTWIDTCLRHISVDTCSWTCQWSSCTSLDSDMDSRHNCRWARHTEFRCTRTDIDTWRYCWPVWRCRLGTVDMGWTDTDLEITRRSGFLNRQIVISNKNRTKRNRFLLFDLQLIFRIRLFYILHLHQTVGWWSLEYVKLIQPPENIIPLLFRCQLTFERRDRHGNRVRTVPSTCRRDIRHVSRAEYISRAWKYTGRTHSKHSIRVSTRTRIVFTSRKLVTLQRYRTKKIDGLICCAIIWHFARFTQIKIIISKEVVLYCETNMAIQKEYCSTLSPQ